MKIGIDLDDVVFKFTELLVEIYNKKFGKDLNFENIFTYSLNEIWHLDKQESLDFFKEVLTEDFTENLFLGEFVKEVLFELAKTNEIFFVTSRVYRDGTLKSLNKHFSEINFELLFSSNPYYKNEGKTKGEICSELGIDFMVEDSVEHAIICAEKGIKTFLMDKPWNRTCVGYENIVRVKNWKEVLEKLNEY